jgi:hypothetical protein
MSNFVFVVDTNRQPLSLCTAGMARSLLKAGKAAVFRRYPFTIILNKAVVTEHFDKLSVPPCRSVVTDPSLRHAQGNATALRQAQEPRSGRSVDSLEVLTSKPLLIAAKGHGTRQMCGTDKYGFPTRHRSRMQIHKGFQTGDLVAATVTTGKKIGFYVGRVLCRASGNFDIATSSGRVAGISHKYCQAIHKKDGYSYGF